MGAVNEGVKLYDFLGYEVRIRTGGNGSDARELQEFLFKNGYTWNSDRPTWVRSCDSDVFSVDDRKHIFHGTGRNGGSVIPYTNKATWMALLDLTEEEEEDKVDKKYDFGGHTATIWTGGSTKKAEALQTILFNAGFKWSYTGTAADDTRAQHLTSDAFSVARNGNKVIYYGTAGSDAVMYENKYEWMRLLGIKPEVAGTGLNFGANVMVVRAEGDDRQKLEAELLEMGYHWTTGLTSNVRILDGDAVVFYFSPENTKSLSGCWNPMSSHYGDYVEYANRAVWWPIVTAIRAADATPRVSPKSDGPIVGSKSAVKATGCDNALDVIQTGIDDIYKQLEVCDIAIKVGKAAKIERSAHMADLDTLLASQEKLNDGKEEVE